jgi:hypothetical protein
VLLNSRKQYIVYLWCCYLFLRFLHNSGEVSMILNIIKHLYILTFAWQRGKAANLKRMVVAIFWIQSASIFFRARDFELLICLSIWYFRCIYDDAQNSVDPTLQYWYILWIPTYLYGIKHVSQVINFKFLPHRDHSVSVRKTNRWMLHGKIMVIYDCSNYTNICTNYFFITYTRLHVSTV